MQTVTACSRAERDYPPRRSTATCIQIRGLDASPYDWVLISTAQENCTEKERSENKIVWYLLASRIRTLLWHALGDLFITKYISQLKDHRTDMNDKESHERPKDWTERSWEWAARPRYTDLSNRETELPIMKLSQSETEWGLEHLCRINKYTSGGVCIPCIRMSGESYHRRLRSLLLCLCEVFRALITRPCLLL